MNHWRYFPWFASPFLVVYIVFDQWRSYISRFGITVYYRFIFTTKPCLSWKLKKSTSKSCQSLTNLERGVYNLALEKYVVKGLVRGDPSATPPVTGTGGHTGSAIRTMDGMITTNISKKTTGWFKKTFAITARRSRSNANVGTLTVPSGLGA